MLDEMNLVEITEKDFAGELTSSNKTVFCSMNPEDINGKKILYRAMSAPDKKIAECQNIKIKMKDLYCETVQCKDDQGIMKECPRIVIIDDKGISYQSVSFGVFNSIKRIITVFGPPTWTEPITVIPKQVASGKNKINILEIE